MNPSRAFTTGRSRGYASSSRSAESLPPPPAGPAPGVKRSSTTDRPIRRYSAVTRCVGCHTPLHAWRDRDGDWHWVDSTETDWCDHPDHEIHEPDWTDR